ncbi:outer membrane protein transport protein [Acidiferrobacter sp.]|uniref:OmpP1/FadL family transporter n=1 Tax=Acidiferrobacter sp. TaxID=1872107 RepID=UPI0026049ADA|nr:outer membrane protein transport protein [Acidiferrobacter sp.]
MRPRSSLLAASLIVVAGLGAAHASGFAISELSITGLSESDALVANTYSLGALAYNPAAMAFHKGGYDLGLLGIYDHTQVTPAGGAGPVVATTPHWQTMPDLFWADKIAPHTRFGFGINEPYGLQIAWPAQTFPTLAQGPAAALAPTYTQLRLFDVAPSFSYRFGPVAVDAGADYYDAHRTVLGTPFATVSGSGAQVGAHVGALGQWGTLGVGINYRSAVNVPLDGTFSVTGSSVPINATLHLPWQWAVGVNEALNTKLGVEFDFDRTGWSRFSNIVVTPAPGAGGGPALLTSTYDWQSSNAYRLGVHYALSRHVRLRAGYAYDVTGATNTDFSARVPDANRQEFSFGASQRLGAWSLSAGYMYVLFNTRTYASATPLSGTDPNGTSAYNGTYQTHAQLFGVSISRRFS